MGVGAELAACGATTLAVVGAVPQLHRVVVTGRVAGVSASAAGLGVATEATWIGYTVAGEMWAAVPEACLMLVSNLALLGALVRAGTKLRRPAVAGVAWMSLLAATSAAGGLTALAAVLAVAYGVQLAPAVWSAYRTAAPSGVSAATWALVAVESLLWGVYGIGHRDPANMSFGVIGTVGATAIVVRIVSTRATRWRRARPDPVHGDGAARPVRERSGVSG
jgi:hypothetical protein